MTVVGRVGSTSAPQHVIPLLTPEGAPGTVVVHRTPSADPRRAANASLPTTKETVMNRLLSLALLCAAITLGACAVPDRTPGKPEYMVVGIDNKVSWGDDGKVQFSAPGKDAVTIVDIGTDPANPKIVANLPLMNSI